MLPLSEKVLNTETSQTLALAARAKLLKDSGIDIVSLTAGEPDFPTPRHVKDAAIKAIEEDFTHYTANEGISELLLAIVKKFSKENNLHFTQEQILVSTGAKQCIFNALQALCNRGDEVIILSPYWVSYPEIVKLADAIPVIVQMTIAEGFRPNVQRIQDAISPKTKAIILNTPGNPTGVVYTRQELLSLASLVRESGIYVISDEIYEKVIYDGREHVSIGSLDDLRDQVITVNGVSKAYAMTGWRIGYMGGPVDVIRAAAKVQSQVTSNATSISQKATIAALNGSNAEIASMVKEFNDRRRIAYSALREIPRAEVILPEGAFYFLIGIRAFYAARSSGCSIRNSTEMTQYLLETHKVALVPGAAFGAVDCVRLSYACSMTDLQKGIERIKAGLKELMNSH